MSDLFSSADGTCECGRCGARCGVKPVPGSKARMLRRNAKPTGLCVNCAVHDQLRHLYPANLMLARSGPKALALPHIQDQFAALLRAAGSDAEPDEIDWASVIENWDLPFPHKLRSTATNPVTQAELDREETRSDTSFLTEQERRAKAKAARDHAMRKLFPGKKARIVDDGCGMIDVRRQNE